ncbi:MAG: response regulator [Defluviitaleaceae bacterium]|nr:response regulator [Defluviitaleaceae bacterium]
MDKKNSILIVDDDRLNLVELSRILSEYTIYAVTNGEEALKSANEHLPDLILLDIIMPGINGFDVFKELQVNENTASIPVIFISGMGSSKDESMGLSLGAVDYIRKPYDSTIVKLRVSSHLKIINLQREREHAVITAENASKSKTAFLESMSHEICTPMNAIMGITNMILQRNSLSGEDTDALNKIYASSEMLLDIINDILDLSKIEAGKISIFTAEYEIASVINDAINLNVIRVKSRPIEFTLEIDENVPARMVGDAVRIKQILNNLLSNAFKFTIAGKITLSVKSEPTEDGIILGISVSDTGCGLSPEQLETLFDDYSRFTPDIGGITIEGTGLGLAITKQLAELMDAEISVESQMNVGSTFSVKIPQKVNSNAVLGKDAADNLRRYHLSHMIAYKKIFPKALTQMPHGRVLIVDDVEINLYVAEGIMEPYGLQIELVSSAKEAIEKIIGGNIYDIIFMDYMMPKMNGVEATLHIRSLKYTHPIIALTANTFVNCDDLFMKNGFDGCITKPIDVKEVDRILNKFVRVV